MYSKWPDYNSCDTSACRFLRRMMSEIMEMLLNIPQKLYFIVNWENTKSTHVFTDYLLWFRLFIAKQYGVAIDPKPAPY